MRKSCFYCFIECQGYSTLFIPRFVGMPSMNVSGVLYTPCWSNVYSRGSLNEDGSFLISGLQFLVWNRSVSHSISHVTCPVTYRFRYESDELGIGILATLTKIVPGGCAIGKVPSDVSCIVCLSVFGIFTHMGASLESGVVSHTWFGYIQTFFSSVKFVLAVEVPISVFVPSCTITDDHLAYPSQSP